MLDTHVFLWFLNGDRRLSPSVRSAIEDGENEILLSIASIWEIAIKSSIGKLTLLKSFAELIPEKIDEMEINLMAITIADLTIVETLLFHHRDPFDRLLIAQAIHHNLPIASDDPQFKQYNANLMW